jgi:LysM repeat protein
MKNKHFWLALVAINLSSCSPMRSSAHDERHLWELTLHEVQTNLDDVRHDISCFKTDLQILEERTRSSESALASLKQEQGQVAKLSQQLANLEKKWGAQDKLKQTDELQKLLAHANETTLALTQFKERIQELENELLSQGRKFDKIAKKETSPSNHYKVRPGDSLEKIARAHNTSVEKVKKLNHLETDRIVPGQQLTLPDE